MNSTFAENASSSRPGVFESHDVALVIASVATNIIVALPLNGCVMWLILRRAGETLASDFFSLNLAMSEIIYSFATIFYILFMELNLFFCFEAFMFSSGLLFTARPLFQCCICVECYLGVVHPVFFLRYKPLRYRVACCCVAWLITLASCLYSMHTFYNTLYLYGFFIQNLLFIAVMLFCCLTVVRALKHPGPGERPAEKKKSNSIKRRAFKIILFITVSKGVNFFLYVAAIPLQCCLNSVDFTSVFTVCTTLAISTGFTQPLLYLHRNRKLTCFRGL